MTQIAILGLGAMGSRIVRTMLQAGHTVSVYNRSLEPAAALQAEGATVAATPRAAADGANIVISKWFAMSMPHIPCGLRPRRELFTA